MTQTILVTGGTGTFGHAFTTYTLTHFPDAKIRLLSRGEAAQVRMRERFKEHSARLTFIIGDVRDRQRLITAMYGVDTVIHAAAMKVVPLIESDPLEAIKTNVMGSVNVVEAAIEAGVEKAILISSDKAVNPLNLYGASKLCAEKMFVAASAYTGGREKPIFGVVRYGNVLGSRGSVVQAWRRQVERGEPISITNPNATRFLITPTQAVAFVHWALGHMEDGGIYMPAYLPAATVGDMAKAVKPGEDYPMRMVGLRAGEKLHEELISVWEWANVRAMREDEQEDEWSRGPLPLMPFAWEIRREREEGAAGVHQTQPILSSGSLRPDRYLSVGQIRELIAQVGGDGLMEI